MREALLGASSQMDGPIWGGNVRLARVLAATIPSGDANVVRLREDLITIVDIPENCPVLPVQWVTPVIDITTIERPWPVQYIYVGHGPHGCGSKTRRFVRSLNMELGHANT